MGHHITHKSYFSLMSMPNLPQSLYLKVLSNDEHYTVMYIYIFIRHIYRRLRTIVCRPKTAKSVCTVACFITTFQLPGMAKLVDAHVIGLWS